MNNLRTRAFKIGGIAILGVLLAAGPAGADVAAIDPDTDNVLESDGSVLRVQGTVTCTADQVGYTLRVGARVEQGSSKAVRVGENFTCTGGVQTFVLHVPRVAGPPFTSGPAVLTVGAQTAVAGDTTPSDSERETESVTVVVTGGA